MLTNYSSSSYNSLQLGGPAPHCKTASASRPTTPSAKSSATATAICRSRFQAFLDINNPKLERSRANFDLNHMIKAFGDYDLPFGKGHRLGYRPLNRVIGGWTVSAAL